MPQSNVIPLFRDEIVKKRLNKPVYVECRKIGLTTYEIIDDNGEVYSTYRIWEKEYGAFLKSIVVNYYMAGREDLNKSSQRFVDVLMGPINKKPRYLITLGFDNQYKVPGRFRIHRRALESLRVARLAYYFGISNIDMEELP